MTTEYTITEFANSFNPNFTRQAILKNINSKIIIASKNKKGKYVIDIANKKNREFIKNTERKFTKKPVEVIKPKKPKKKKSVKEIKPKLKEKAGPVNLPVEKNEQLEIEFQQPDDKLPPHIIEMLDSGKSLKPSEVVDMPKQWVEKIKLYEMTKQIRQKREQERGELISKKMIRITLGKLFEIHINEFLTVKSKVIPDIAGLFASTDEVKKLKAEKIIDAELWEVLKHIKIEFNNFLTKINTDAID